MQFSMRSQSQFKKMCYSIEPRERRFVKGYGFLSFTRNLSTHSIKVY